MEIADWWPKLDPETQHWLKYHERDALTDEVLEAIVAAGGAPEGEFTPGVGQEAPDRYDLTQNDWYWIETEAE